MDEVKKAADEYNKIAAVAAKAGIQQGLHNEGFELSRWSTASATYDILFDLLDPKLVKFQFQMSTIGQRLRRGRLLQRISRPLHLDARPGRRPERDAAPAASTPCGGRSAGCAGGGRRRRRPRPSQKAVGEGTIDWAKTFEAAKIGGVKNYFVEQNMELTKASVAALKTMK